MKPQSNASLIDKVVAWLRGLFGSAGNAARRGIDRTISSRSADKAGSLANPAQEKADTAKATETSGSVEDRARRAANDLSKKASGLGRPLERDGAATGGVEGDAATSENTGDPAADAAADASSGVTGEPTGQAGAAVENVADSASGPGDDVPAPALRKADDRSDQAEVEEAESASGSEDETSLSSTSATFTATGPVTDDGDAAGDGGDAGDVSGAAETATATGERPLESLGLFGEPGSATVTDLSYLDQQDEAWFSFDEGDASAAPAVSDAGTTFDTPASEVDALSDQGHDSAGGWVTSWSDGPDADSLVSIESASEVTQDVSLGQDTDAEDAEPDIADTGDDRADAADSATVSAATESDAGADAAATDTDDAADGVAAGSENTATSTTNEAGSHAGQVKGNADGSCPVEFPIKGNGSSMIYHAPGRASYEATIAEWCFATEEAAEAAGYRAPKR